MNLPESAVDIAAAVQADELSAREVTERSLARIAERDGDINAYTVVTVESARRTADDIDRRARAGERLGPLAGVPVSVKDHIWLAGHPATNGSLAFAEFVPAVSAVPVQRLIDADAVVVGKTNNPEFCYRGTTDNDVWGLTRNPRDLSRTPGGSSGGAGASVAAGTVPLAVGTDGGGSIRIPSAFCGVAGLKPTFGLIPKLPGFRGWPTLSVDGPLAADVGDLLLALEVMAGPDPADPLSYPTAEVTRQPDVDGLHVAVSADLGFADLDDDVRALFAAFVERIAAAGMHVATAHPATERPNRLWDTVAFAEGFASEGPLLGDWADRMSEGVADLVRAGEHTTAREYLDAQDERLAYTRAWEEFFTAGAADVLICPTLPTVAFGVDALGPASIGGRPQPDGFDEWCALCLPANLTGQPAASIPIGLGADDLPVGAQIIGPRGSDRLVLALAAVLTDQPPK